MNRTRSLVLTAIFALGCVFYYYEHYSTTQSTTLNHSASDSEVHAAYTQKRSDVQVSGFGTVSRILPDDLKGSKHQKFILELPSGITVLIAHNIDLAPRIPRLQKGDTVQFFGEYEWNAKGGVVHWTHHDPRHKHVDGWLKHENKTYQ